MEAGPEPVRIPSPLGDREWVNGSVLIVFLGLAVMEDERRNSEKFGERYKDYRERVPMVNIFVVIGRRFFRKRRGSCDK